MQLLARLRVFEVIDGWNGQFCSTISFSRFSFSCSRRLYSFLRLLANCAHRSLPDSDDGDVCDEGLPLLLLLARDPNLLGSTLLLRFVVVTVARIVFLGFDGETLLW